MNLRRKFKQTQNAKENKLTPIAGLIGDGLGNVLAPDGKVYVRIDNNIMKVPNTNIALVNNESVWVGYEPTQPGVFKILNQRIIGDNIGINAPSRHANTHEWLGTGTSGGTDVLKVQLGQIMPLRIIPYTDFKIMIYPGVVKLDTGYKLIADINDSGKPVPKIIDLAVQAAVADSKAKFLLLTIDLSGDIIVTSGAEVDMDDLTILDIPEAPAETKYELGSVRAYSGMTQFQENRETTDVVDARFPMPHTHPVGDLQDITWTDIIEKPEEFPPEDHTHFSVDIVDLENATVHDAIKISGIDVNLLEIEDGDILVYNSGGSESLFDPSNLTKSASATVTNLFDGNVTNQWLDNSASHWLKFNFGYRAYISKIVITANAGDWMWADFPDDIYTYGSNTGAFGGEEVEMDHYAPGAVGVYTRTFSEPRTPYKYYKMTFGRPSHACRINEIEIYTVPAEHRFENQQPVHDAVKIDGIDVDLTGITGGNALVYDEATTKIIAGEGGGGASAMSDLTDVDLTGLADENILVYDSTSSKWLPEAQSGGGAALTVEEADGTPSVGSVVKIKVTNGTLTDDGSGVVSLDFGSAATDGSAIHDNEANEISAITEKTTLEDDDLLLIEDSNASYVKKKVKVSNLPSSGGGGETDVLMVQVFS